VPKTAPTQPIRPRPASSAPGPAPAPIQSSSPPPKPAPPPVKPSPSSNVSNLTTTQTQSAPSSGGGSSSQTSSGSGSSGSTSPPTGSYSSSNWAGYFAASGAYNAVSANWVAPTIAATSDPGSADATWIGIGGITAGDLIQVGTDNIISSSGQVSTAAFYEMLPYSSTPINSLKISQGDQISAALNEVSVGIWDISLTDNTTNQTFTKTVSYSSSLSSAEWIEEDPANNNGQLYPLDDFGNVAFSNCLSAVNGTAETIAAAGASSVTMEDASNQPVATPSALGSDGASFNVIRQ
jgi:hypothetical protein